MVLGNIAIIDITESFCNQIAELQEFHVSDRFKSEYDFGQNDSDRRNNHNENEWVCLLKLSSLKIARSKQVESRKINFNLRTLHCVWIQ